MLFGTDTPVVPSNIVFVLDGGPGPQQEEEIWGDQIGEWNPQSKFALQIVAKLLQIV